MENTLFLSVDNLAQKEGDCNTEVGKVKPGKSESQIVELEKGSFKCCTQNWEVGHSR